MTSILVGGSSRSHGCCPGCGLVVPRTHEWSTEGLRDVFACMRCGTFQYGTAPIVPYAAPSYHASVGVQDVLAPFDITA